ncbi:MAG TPA: SDR family NAD(P)-dependent oxidoreductase [Glaciibacter sp.]|nr:SDR family NAD(P)-dependent oxidoreductase [Glaciibacter sp.]
MRRPRQTATNSSTARVVVITGASSGIGRATALAFAKQKANLVLAARSEPDLVAVAAECRERGSEVLVRPTDVSDESRVKALAEAAVARFGRIDVWVGAASVFSYGTFEQTPPAVFRQVLETTFFGQVYGARAVLPHFRRQGGGVLILVGSVYSRITTPYVSAYVASKQALLGFAEVLGQEVRRDRIAVCSVLPATIDTPIYQHAANYTAQRVHPLPPVVSPYRVARTIVHLARRPRRLAVVGQVQRGFLPVHDLLPWLFHPGIRVVMNTIALRGGTVAATDGTVFEPQPDSNRITGGWRRGRVRRLGAIAVLGAAVLAVGSRRRSPGR